MLLLPLACGGADPAGAGRDGDAARDASVDAGPAAPLLADAWQARYRFSMPGPGGPRIELPALLETWVGRSGPPGLAEALDFWLRSAAPPALGRFIAAYNALQSDALVVEIEGATEVDAAEGWALDDWRQVRVEVACPSRDLTLNLSAAAARDLGLGSDGWGPYAFEVSTSSSALRVAARRTGVLDGRALRRLRSRAAVACAIEDAGAAKDLSAFLHEVVRCEHVVEPLGRLGGVARGACEEGLRRVVDWIESDAVRRYDVVMDMTGVGFGRPARAVRGGAATPGLSVSYAPAAERPTFGPPTPGTWSWTR